MAHIQQGDNRQYFSTESAADYSGQVAELFNQGLNSTISITQKANESTMASNQIDLSTKFLAKNNEINTKWQADPTNPNREIELKQAFDSLAEQYKINPLCQKQWSDIKTNVYDRYKTYNAEWVEKQQQSNIQSNLKNGYESLVNQVSMLGLNGSSVDEMRLVYANGIEGLKNGAIAGLGEVTVNDFLKDSNHDIMATYLSALALNNPLEAQKLLNDEGVRNDIGRAETLDKLENYITSSLVNQNKRTAVNELGNTLRNMKSEEADNIINGKADLNKVMKFIETNKNLPEGSKDLILDIYGIGSKTDYYYDRDKKQITKHPEAGSGRGGRSGRSSSGSLIALKKLSKTQKEDIALNLEQGLYDMFSFDDIQPINAKKVLNNGQAGNIQGGILSRLKNVAEAQGAIDTAYNTGIINKSQRQGMMNKFIEPMTNYLEANMQDLDEKQNWFGSKLGYSRLKQEFSTEGIPSNQTNKIRAQQKMLLAAQGSYYSSLETARQKLNLNSIYDIEKLPSEQQKQIYKNASDNAIAFAKRYGEHPEIFFEKEYPQLYAQGVSMFGIKDGQAVAKKVAQEIYQNTPEGKEPDVKKAMSNALINMYSIKQDKALMTKIKLYEKYHVMPAPKLEFKPYTRELDTVKNKENEQKYKNYMMQRMKSLNVQEKDLNDTAKQYKITPSQVLSMLELQKYKQKTGKDFSTFGYN